MTVGNDTQDHRVLTGNTCGAAWVGRYWKRVWSGGDASPILPDTPAVLDPQNGLYVGGRWGRPPKRGRSRGEHDYVMTLTSFNNPAILWRQGVLDSWKTGAISNCFGDPGFTYLWGANDDIRLIGKLRQEIIGSDFNPAITMAEGKESLETIIRAAKAIDGALRHAKRGNLSAAWKSVAQYERKDAKSKGARTAAGNWLNLELGIKPILSDTYNAAIALAHLTSVPMRKVITVTARSRGVIDASPAIRAYGYATSVGKIKAILEEVNLVKLIGLTDPAGLVWEKTSLSFVADWFIPIGAFLEARGVSNSLTGTFVTTRFDKSYMTVGSGSHDVQFIGAGYYWRDARVTRTVSTSLSVPLPRVKPMKDWLTWSRATTAVSLVTSYATN